MLLSVCIPTRNRRAFISVSARYWLEQMAPFADRVELIIADNASQDGTAAELEKLRALGAFRLISRPQDIGFNGSTHDLVVHQAQGEYVWVCGDDDYLNVRALARVLSALEANPGQDHFYLATQFVPSDHAPDLTHEDPRQSPHLHRPSGHADNRLVPAREILAQDGGGFGGFYSSIWRKPLAIEALSGDFRRLSSFTTLEATLPYAVYVARHRLALPCFRIVEPVLTVVHTISWPQHAALFRLRFMPGLYDLYAAQGVPASVLQKHRLELLDHWPRHFLDLLRRRRESAVQDFSFTAFVGRHFFQAKFWKEAGRYIWCDLLP